MALHRVSPVITLMRCRLRRHSRHPLHRSERPIYSSSQGSTQLRIVSTVKKTRRRRRGGGGLSSSFRTLLRTPNNATYRNIMTKHANSFPLTAKSPTCNCIFTPAASQGDVFFNFILFRPARRLRQKN